MAAAGYLTYGSLYSARIPNEGIPVCIGRNDVYRWAYCQFLKQARSDRVSLRKQPEGTPLPFRRQSDFSLNFYWTDVKQKHQTGGRIT